MILSTNKKTAVYQIYLIFGCLDAWYLSRYIFCPNNYVLIFVSKSEAKNVYESILVFSMVFPTFVNVNQAFPLIDFPSLPDFPSYIKCVNATTSKYKWIFTITTRLGNFKVVKYQVWSSEVITLHNKTTSGKGFLQNVADRWLWSWANSLWKYTNCFIYLEYQFRHKLHTYYRWKVSSKRMKLLCFLYLKISFL